MLMFWTREERDLLVFRISGPILVSPLRREAVAELVTRANIHSPTTANISLSGAPAAAASPD